MFEFRVAYRYLIPKRKSLSTALISLMSVLVISLVVWLVIVFLSVTTGIEKNWLKKLTSLHAPLRLTPTDLYYSSYYYQIDRLSAASNYSLKTIGEKRGSPLTDPYAADVDAEIPSYWPEPDLGRDRRLSDPVKTLYRELSSLKEEFPDLAFQDYEIGGALLRLKIHPKGGEAPSFLSQMSYLLSLTNENPHLRSLFIDPTPNELTQLLRSDPSLLKYISVKEVKTLPLFTLHPSLLEPHRPFAASLNLVDRSIAFDTQEEKSGLEKGTLVWDGKELHFHSPNSKDLSLGQLPIQLETPLTFFVKGQSDTALDIVSSLQNHQISGEIPLQHLELIQGAAQLDFDAPPSSPPPWGYFVKGQCHLPTLGEEIPLLLPKNYRDSGVLLGNGGTLSYAAPGALSNQEQRIPIRVAGFYDPGILSVGNKCLIVPSEITQTIHAASQTFSPDGTPTNGLFVWFKNLEQADAIKEILKKRLEESAIAPYWKIATYREFEFSKDLMFQFQSDRTLFMLIAAIILAVACCNVISLLVLLVNDKKKEIAILQSMGASFWSIAAIFGICGVAMGSLSCLIGGGLAIFTLHHLDSLVAFLSALQGHAAFNPAFFGKALPNQLSMEALLFVLIATPILSLVAGLIPALKASRIRPSSVLRSE